MSWHRFCLGLLLTAVAGAIDGVSFLRLGAVYASFMSGNTVQLGLHTAAADWTALGYFMVLIGHFIVGGFLGSLVTTTAGRWSLTLILLLEGAAIALALWLDLQHLGPLASTAPLSLAMGAQNNLVILVRGANPATTFVTGTAFRFGEAVAQRVLGRDPKGAWKLHAIVWLSFGIGAAIGAQAQHVLQGLSLLPLAAFVTLLALVSAVVEIVTHRPAVPATP